MQYFTLMYKSDGHASIVRANQPRGVLLTLVESQYPHFQRTSLHHWHFLETVDGIETVTAEVYLEAARKTNTEESHV